MQLHHLGTVDEALARVDDHVGLLVAPSRERGRPLVGAAQLVHLATADDQAAVDETDDRRRKLARGDGHHRLVQLAEAGCDLPLREQRPPLPHGGEREQVGVAESLRQRGGGAGGRVRSCSVARGCLLQHDGQKEVAPLHAVTVVTLDKPLRPCKPAARRAELIPIGEVEADPDRAVRRAGLIVRLDIRLSGPFQ